MQTDDGTRDPLDFECFVQATGNQTFRTALLLCGDWHLAEDLTQTTYAKLFARWPRVRAADSPPAYARTVLLNTYLSHRRLRRSSEHPVADVPDGTDVRGGWSSSAAVDPSTRVALLDALRALSRTDRAVLVLRFWEDRSVSQTGRDLGISDGAVRTRTIRAIGRLRALLDTDFPELVND
jgi:RNA polymerase sigma-70 factor (sigma-E family)